MKFYAEDYQNYNMIFSLVLQDKHVYIKIQNMY